MKNAYVDVAKLDSLENVGIPRKACKLAEETGELMQVICRYVGMKSNQMSADEMLEEAFGEVADVIQNCFCIANQFGITDTDLTATPYTLAKTKKINLDNLAKEGLLMFSQVGKVVSIVDSYTNGETSKKSAVSKLKKRLTLSIEATLVVARSLGIKFETIEPKILEKNKKWMLRIEKKHLKKKRSDRTSAK